ncbi:MAG: PorT family protein [Bacteroidales bacterium]|jgi:hypothetical protein|nr:PorT family protein [Bacteroidales bacterium]
MKRIFVLAAVAVSMIFASSARAQLAEGMHFGILGGFTSSSATVKDFDVKSVALYHAGITAKFNLGLGFAIQPSIIYQVKGATVEQIFDKDITKTKDQFDYKFGFVEVPVQIQWGPDLVALRPYAFVEPFIGYGITNEANEAFKSSFESDVIDYNVDKDLSNMKNTWKEYGLNRLEYGLGLGAGIEFWHVQVSAQYFWNFGTLYQGADGAEAEAKGIFNNIKNAFTEKRSFNGIKLSVALMF